MATKTASSRAAKAFNPFAKLTLHGAPPNTVVTAGVRDMPDARDVIYSVAAPVITKGLPTKVDLRPQCPLVHIRDFRASSAVAPATASPARSSSTR